MPEPSQEAQRLHWEVASFSQRLPGVVHALVVSVDGLPLAVTPGLDRAATDQLAAVTSGLVSLSQGAARHLGGRGVRQTMVEMDDGALLVMIVGHATALAVLTTPDCDLRLLAYEMQRLIAETNRVISPALQDELRAALPR